jgi:hypothetical protein
MLACLEFGNIGQPTRHALVFERLLLARLSHVLRTSDDGRREAVDRLTTVLRTTYASCRSHRTYAQLPSMDASSLAPPSNSWIGPQPSIPHMISMLAITSKTSPKFDRCYLSTMMPDPRPLIRDRLWTLGSGKQARGKIGP